MDWKNKYLKYKSKYLKLKNILENNPNQLGGGSDEENKTYLEIIKNNLKEHKWDKESMLLDCVKTTTMQTETNKLIDYMISNDMIELDKKTLDIVLTYAVFKGLYIIVEKLIRLGANPGIIYKKGQTLADIAFNLYFYKTASVLKNFGSHSKNFYNPNQLPTQYNFSKDPENYVKDIDEIGIGADSIYLELKEKLLSKSPYTFENTLKSKFKDNIEIS